MKMTRRHWAAAGLVTSTILAASVMSALPAEAAPTTYVVNNTVTCSDTAPGAGTATLPFCTIGQGALVAVAGDTVSVSAGTYAGTAVNPANSGTAAGGAITFTAAPAVVITGGTEAFALMNRSDIAITNFHISHTSSYGISIVGGVGDLIAGNHVSFSGLPVLGKTADGIFVQDLITGAISGNLSHDNAGDGIYLLGITTRVRVQGNRTYHNAYQFERNAVGIDIAAPGNTVVHNASYANEDSGIQVITGGNNTLVTGNAVWDNGDHGIDNRNVIGGTVTGNTVYYNCTSGINLEGMTTNYVVENNIAMNNATGAIINPTPINPPNAYSNNCRRRTGNIGIYDSAVGTTTANFDLVWQSGAGAEYVWNNVVYSTRAALHTATGAENRGIFANPRFVNAAAFNFTLTSTSPAIDSANSSAPGEQYTDILGHKRLDDPFVVNTGVGIRRYDDRGTYEFR